MDIINFGPSLLDKQNLNFKKMNLPDITEQQLNKIQHYFPDLSNSQRNQLAQLYPLYVEWNAKINVVSRKDIENLYLHHVLHSLSIAKIVSFNEGATVLDVGTGGGFPGIPLAILFPETHFYLVDSIGKKIKVVQAVAEALQLQNVKAEQIRAEQVNGQFDFVITRAVARMQQLHQWVHRKIKAKSTHDLYNGMICLKGGGLRDELQEVKINYALYPLSDFFKESFFETKHLVYVPA